MAYLHLLMLAYRLGFMIRQQLKVKQINSSWSEFLGITTPHLLITTTGQNALER